MKYYIIISALIIAVEAFILVYLIKKPLKQKKALEVERDSMVKQLDKNIRTIVELEKKREKLRVKAKKIDNPKSAFAFLRAIRRK